MGSEVEEMAGQWEESEWHWVRVRAKVLWHRVKVGAGTHVVYKFREF